MFGASTDGYGVYGVSTNGVGVVGDSKGANYGVFGESIGNYGIYGRSRSAAHGGVLGSTANSTYYGILGHADTYSFYGSGTLRNSGGAVLYGSGNCNGGGGVCGATVYNGLNVASAGIDVTGTSRFNSVVDTLSTLNVYGALYFWGATQANYTNYLCFNPSTYRVSRNTTCTGSDIRLKKDIVDSPYGLEAVMRLRPVTFLWKDETHMGSERQVGLIAQEVEKVIPEVVSKPKGPDDTYGLKYETLVVPLVTAVQDLKRENDALRARLDALEADMAALSRAE